MKTIFALTSGIVIFSLLNFQSVAQNTYQKAWNFGFGINQTSPASISLRADSGLYVLSNALSSVFVDRFDSQGNSLWHYRLSGSSNPTGNTVSATSDGGCYVSGTMFPQSPQNSDIFLAKMDSSANLIWVRSIGGSGNDFGTDAVAIYLNCMVSGSYTRSGTQRGVLMYITSNSNGALNWIKEFRDTVASGSYINRIVPFGTKFLLCTVNSYAPPSTNGIDGGLVITDPFGNMLINKVYHFPEWGQFGDAKPLPGGDFLVSGYIDLTNDSINERDFFLMRTDSMLNVLWAKAYSFPGDDLGNRLTVTSDGDFVITGSLTTQPTTSGTAIVKVDSAGNIIWTNQFYSLTTSPGGNISIPASGNGLHVLSTRKHMNQNKNYLIKVDQNGLGYCNDFAPQFTVVPVNFQTSSPYATDPNPPHLFVVEYFSNIIATYNELIVCNPTGIDEIAGKSGDAYPNPSPDGYFTIQWSGTQPVFSCFDITGRAVPITAEATGEGRWSIGPLPRGVYMLSVNESNASTTVKLFSGQ